MLTSTECARAVSRSSSLGRTGIVFDISEFTVHDGPGLRTTVFMKGCPLRCAWCHNPEGLSPGPQLMRTRTGERAVGQVFRSTELAEILNRQAPLLRGGGGVTFSGGEPLAQAAFVAEVIGQLDRLHVVLQTSGFASESRFRKVVACVDLVLLDLKLADPAAHRRWTGADNRPILRNVRALSEMGTPFVVRVPLVPGVTDTERNLRGIAARVRDAHSLVRIELLPYNRAAGGKYTACDMRWCPGFDESRPPNTDVSCLRDCDVEVRVL